MVIGVIPARLNSSRFPKKILADLGGKPMIVYVAEQASKAKKLDKVVIAIDDKETQKALEGFDYNFVMTSKNHQSGTDRVSEVVKKESEAEIIINIQGDEPLIDPDLIDGLVNLFKDNEVEMGTIISRKITVSELLDKNIVKAILDEKQNIKDFKRNVYDIEIGAVYRHIGIYAYTRDVLFKFQSFLPSEREIEKSLEQLRALDNGIKIRGLITNCDQIAVDTIEDFNRVKDRMGISENLINKDEK
tara:strand:- start:361 stop:1098 length:738 start_codon:yes stop_codon:yes gene_type:complete